MGAIKLNEFTDATMKALNKAKPCKQEGDLMEELKPCPFCGDDMKDDFIDGIDQFWLEHICLPYIKLIVYGETKEEVVRNWNTRAADGEE